MTWLTINGTTHRVDISEEMPLLWVLRDLIGLTGTRYGCGKGLCGACTVHVDGTATRACITPAAALEGRAITTIEGLASDGLHPLQQAWIDHGVPQCGFCQAGQLMSAAALLARSPNPTDAELDATMSGNICRCGTYERIRRGIRDAAARMTPPSAIPSDPGPATGGEE